MSKAHLTLERFFWLLVLGLVVFFARWNERGLQPDAALYSGLSLKILRTGEFWLLSGSPERFPQFFEHPPFFFQWGSWVLKAFGTSDGAARAIGGIFGFLGFLALTSWLWLRMGWATAVIAACMAATWGHYTKFASTSMLEGPFSFGVCLVALATFEKHWVEKTGFKRPLFTLLGLCGLFIATASKGVMGLGAWGAMCLSLIFAFVLSPRNPLKILFSCFFLGLALLATLAPFGIWAYALWERNGTDWIIRYFVEQVFRSATTNRGEDFHAVDGDRLYYLKVLLKDGWPWLWAMVAGTLSVVLAPLLAKRFAFFRFFQRPEIFANFWNALAFVLAFFIPLSFLKYQLPHYLHPVYLPLIAVGAVFLARLLPEKFHRFFCEKPYIRWGLVAAAGAGLFAVSQGVTKTPNRGQPFIEVAKRLESLPPECHVEVPETRMDPYRMEAFSLWYWKGREWKLVKSELLSKIAVYFGSVYWDPEKKVLWGGGKCQIKEP